MVLATALAIVRDPIAFLIDGLDAREWRIKSLDEAMEFELEGEFRPRDGLDYEVASALSTSGGYGDVSEVVSFLHGRADRVSVTIELHADVPRKGEDLNEQLEQLEQLARRHPDLLRNPICRFSWGKYFSRRVMFESVRPSIRRLHPNGTLAEVHVALTMIQAVQIAVEVSIPGVPPPESTEVVVAAGETCELIAERFYGDPLKGVNLRLRHPELVAGIETAGSRILAVHKDHPDIRAPVRFVSPPLLEGDDFDEKFRELLASRAAAVTFPR